MMEDIRKAGYNAEKRAEFIAIDQTRKMTTLIYLYNQMGVKKFEWVHSRCNQESSLKLDGQFDISNPPVYNKTGQVGYPVNKLRLCNERGFWCLIKSLMN